MQNAILLLASLCSIAAQPPVPPSDCAELDKVVYSDLSPATLAAHLSIDRLSDAVIEHAVAGLKAERSPHGTAALLLHEPDFSKPGPWTSTLYVRGNGARPLAFSVTFRDHASYGVRARWLNERLLFLQIWLERVASADLILDVGTLRFVDQAAADYGILVQPCDLRRR